jgi:alpha-galactosidase
MCTFYVLFFKVIRVENFIRVNIVCGSFYKDKTPILFCIWECVLCTWNQILNLKNVLKLELKGLEIGRIGLKTCT